MRHCSRLVVIAVAAVIPFLGVSLGDTALPSGQTARASLRPLAIVPDVIGRTHAQAVSILRSRGFAHHKDIDLHDGWVVVEQDPGPLAPGVSLETVIELTFGDPGGGDPPPPPKKRSKKALDKKWRGKLRDLGGEGTH